MSKKPWIWLEWRSRESTRLAPRGDDQVADQFGRDGHPGSVLAVLPGIAVVGEDGCDTPRRGPPGSVDEDEEFHQGIVGRKSFRGADGLDDVNVFPADIFTDLYACLSAGKSADLSSAPLDFQDRTDFICETRVDVAGKDLEIV